MEFKVDGHIIKVDRYIRTLALLIDGKVVDKISGFGKIYDGNLELHGIIQNPDGFQNEIKAVVLNATKIIVFKDNEEIGNGILL